MDPIIIPDDEDKEGERELYQRMNTGSPPVFMNPPRQKRKGCIEPETYLEEIIKCTHRIKTPSKLLAMAYSARGKVIQKTGTMGHDERVWTQLASAFIWERLHFTCCETDITWISDCFLDFIEWVETRRARVAEIIIDTLGDSFIPSKKTKFVQDFLDLCSRTTSTLIKARFSDGLRNSGLDVTVNGPLHGLRANEAKANYTKSRIYYCLLNTVHTSRMDTLLNKISDT